MEDLSDRSDLMSFLYGNLDIQLGCPYRLVLKVLLQSSFDLPNVGASDF